MSAVKPIHFIEGIGDKARVLCGAQKPEKYVTSPYERTVTCPDCKKLLRNRWDA